jgi:hypothetical protein
LVFILIVVSGTVGISAVAIRWARRSSRRAALLGWALQFLGAGMNPVPPPQVQIEEVNRQARLRKEADSGDPKE